ncbi:MAG: putative LPS assembly protein LptD [Edaphocola sp.]
MLIPRRFIAFVLVVCCAVCTQVRAQVLPAKDSTAKQTLVDTAGADSTRLAQNDSLNKAADTGVSDEQRIRSKEQKLGIRIAEDALPALVTTTAKDSAVLDMEENKYYLYGDAKASYTDVNIQSGKLVFDQKNNELSAVPNFDTGGTKISSQEFKQGTEAFTYDTLRYNFKSKRAVVRNAHSQYGDGFVISQQVKRNADESIFGYRSIYTTCDLEHPHFGIRAKKIKVIPGRVIASGPANLEIMDIPTPLFLPFGMFPIKQGQHSGFIMPTYTLQSAKGLGLQRGGYYFAINEHVGLITQFDVFSKGSWGIFNTAQYANRYHYSGSLSFDYALQKTGEDYEVDGGSQTDFNFSWSHSVDPKAHPGTTFAASVNFGTSTYNQRNGMQLNNILTNQYSSSISYAKTWVGKPYSLTVALRHSQSTSSGALTVTLPEINFGIGQFTPFQRKNAGGSPRWYEKITVNYSVAARNTLNTYDSLFTKSINMRNLTNGIQHTASVSASYNIFRYFNWSVSIPYAEYWNTRRMYLLPNSLTEVNDTALQTGFFATRHTSVSSSVSTRIYGMKLFKKGKVAGIRHVLTPTVGFSYSPSNLKSPFNYMYEYVDASGYQSYNSPYAYSAYPTATQQVEQGAITFGLGNTLQMKVRNKDSTGKDGSKNISIIDGLNISGSYNLIADSNNLSIIAMSFRTSLLGKLNLSASANFDAYKYHLGRRTGEFLMANGGGMAKMLNASIATGISLKAPKKNEQQQKDAEANNDEVKRLTANGGIDDYYDFNVPWDLSINAGLSASRRFSTTGDIDSLVFSPSMTFSGGFNLTERWKLTASSGLQFTGFSKVEMGATQFNISRDLHCWQMSLNLIPFGYYRSFFFTLQVKSAVLQDLKLTRRRSYQDNSY